MKIVRFIAGTRATYGVLEKDTIHELAESPFASAVSRSHWTPRFMPERYDVGAVTLLAPCQPTKYVGVGLNYRATAEALNLPIPESPLLYLRPSTGIIATGENIVLPSGTSRVYCEGELAVVIGAKCHNADEHVVENFILGYTVTNDVTDISELMTDHGNPTRSKAHDTFGPVGPCIETKADPRDLRLSTFVDGRQIQEGRCTDMLFSVAQCVSYVSRLMTLLPGDVIAMGAPPVPSPIQPGNAIEVRVDGIGVLANRVVSADP